MKLKWNEVTWYSKLIAIIFLFAIYPALAFYIGTQYELAVYIQQLNLHIQNSSLVSDSVLVVDQVSTFKSTATSTPAISGTTTYVDPKFPFSISYPPDFANIADLTPLKQNSLETFMNVCFRGSDENGGVDSKQTNFCYIGGQAADGFAAASFNIIARTSQDMKQCEQIQNGYQDQPSQLVNINGVMYYQGGLDDAAAGHYTTGKFYRTYHKGLCYELDLFVESDRGVSEKGLSADFSNMMLTKLEAILATFKFSSI